MGLIGLKGLVLGLCGAGFGFTIGGLPACLQTGLLG